MATTNVLLREDVDNLGARGEIVRVKAGYARNFLLPRKLAVEATPGNVKQIDAERAALLKKEAKERAGAEAQSAQMGGLRLSFERKVGEHGLLYGSVTAMHIADALKEKGYEIDRRRALRRPAAGVPAAPRRRRCRNRARLFPCFSTYLSSLSFSIAKETRARVPTRYLRRSAPASRRRPQPRTGAWTPCGRGGRGASRRAGGLRPRAPSGSA